MFKRNEPGLAELPTKPIKSIISWVSEVMHWGGGGMAGQTKEMALKNESKDRNKQYPHLTKVIYFRLPYDIHSD